MSENTAGPQIGLGSFFKRLTGLLASGCGGDLRVTYGTCSRVHGLALSHRTIFHAQLSGSVSMASQT